MATVTVRGTGNARTSEDEASVTLVTEAIEQTAAAALAKVAERTQAALDLCDTLGIEPSARVTAGASVAEHGEHDREGRWQHRGYRAWNQVVVRVGEASVVGELIAGAVDLGAQVNGPAWTIAPPPRPMRMAAMDAGAVEALPVEAGEQLVTAASRSSSSSSSDSAPRTSGSGRVRRGSEPELARDRLHRVRHRLDVLVQVDAEELRAGVDLVAVHTCRE
jgi:uncharacterized protein YggE